MKQMPISKIKEITDRDIINLEEVEATEYLRKLGYYKINPTRNISPGECFTTALQFALENVGISDTEDVVTLYHGRYRQPTQIFHTHHAWIVIEVYTENGYEEYVYDGVLDRVYPLQDYYYYYDIDEWKYYNIEDAKQKLVETGHAGPWV